MSEQSVSHITTGSHGIFYVFSAPSGTGKTSVLREIIRRHPDMVFSVSATTRKPRGDEQNGVDYHFISDKEFDRRVEDSEFIEWAVVHGFRYGTLKNTIERTLEKGRNIITDADTVGALAIKKIFPSAVLIFIAPPSREVLTKRLKSRKTESPELMEKRLAAVPQEMKQMELYNYIVINDSLEVAVEQVNAIITAESLRSVRVVPKLSEWREYLVKN